MNEFRGSVRPKSEWDEPVFDALDVLAPPSSDADGSAPKPRSREDDGRPVSNIIGFFAWHPDLMKSYFAFNTHLFHSTLPPRVRELVIVRTAWLRQSEYEWSHPAGMANSTGVSEAEIEGLQVGPTAEIWSSADATLLRAVDELCEKRNLSDALWAGLAEQLDRQQVMDFVFTVGAYDLISMVTNTFQLELDHGLSGFPRG